MQRFAIATLSTIALSLTVTPASQAKTTPHDLVNLARMGYLQAQGIPSHNGLNDAVAFGQLQAEDLVQAAIADQRLSSDKLNDPAYLSSVQFKLNMLIPN